MNDHKAKEAQDAAPLPAAPAPGGPLDLSNALAEALAAVEALGQKPEESRGARVPSDAAAALTAELADARRAAEQAQLDLSVTRGRYQRLDREHDELRRRLQKAELDLPNFGARRVLLALLPSVDHLDTLLDHLLTAEPLSEEGRKAVMMLRGEWQRTLQSAQVQPFDAVGQTFDPMVHEAIAQAADDNHAPGQVIRQVARGYLYDGRLLRSAQVVVAQPTGQPDAAGPAR